MNNLYEHHKTAEMRLKQAFSFENDVAPHIIYDASYWLFGELPKNIPNGYCSDDPSVMLKYQTEKIKRHYELYPDDCYQGFLMPWFGTSVLASGFGTPVVYGEKMDPAVDIATIKDPDEVYALKKPDPFQDGQMPLVLKAIQYFKEHSDLPIGLTDSQGPLTTALSIIGYENFIYWMYDYPEVIHHLMNLVTEALIDWVALQKEIVGKDRLCSEYILGLRLPEGFGGVWISDDDCVMFDTDNYREFVVPYNSRVLKAFGGGGIHYCGDATQHIGNYLDTEGLTVIHNLNIDDLDAAAKMQRALKEKKIPYVACDFIPSDDRLKDYYAELYSKLDQQGLVVVPYIAPAVALCKGKYESVERDSAQLGSRVLRAIQANQ